MKTKQTVAVIGAGDMGLAISKALSKGNYRILLYSSKADEAQAAVSRIQTEDAGADIEAMPCSREAGWEADIIILAVPYSAEKEVAERIKEVANQKVVVSISNPLNPSYTGLVTAADTSAAEELQRVLPHAKVIKAFNSIFARDFNQPIIEGNQVDTFIAGSDQDALDTVSELVSTAGFNPIVAGPLSASRTLENMQLLLIQLRMKHNYNGAAGWKILHN